MKLHWAWSVWIGVAYIAAVAQVRCNGVETAPNLVLAVATAWWSRHPGSPGVLGIAAAGLLLDSMGHGRLGLHLAVCGVLAALATMALSAEAVGRWWSRPVMSSWLVFGNVAASAGLLAMIDRTPLDLSDSLQRALASALATAGIVAGIDLILFVLGRCVVGSNSVTALRLGNRWNRLTEA
jgi:cell shape-determining protein MreD